MTRYTRPLVALVTGAALLGAAGAATAQTTGAPAAKAAEAKATATKGWRIYQTLSAKGTFWDAAASSWGNAWAVGEGASTATGLAWRWNGHTWGTVTLPSGTRGISAVTTAGVGNTWLLAKNSAKQTVVLRWNNGTWSNPGAAHASGVRHIGAAGANQLWAAGDGFIRHYTGSSWTEKKLPDGVRINRIAVSHYNDVWAVGQKDASGGSDGRPFAMHWNGSKWTTTPVPTYPGGEGWGGSALDGVAAIGANDVYAGGNTYLGEDDNRALLVHWNGTKWSKATLPSEVTDNWVGSVGVTPVGGGGIWYAWSHRHLMRRTPSGTTTDYTLPAKGLPYVNAVAYIPGSTTTLAVGSTGSPTHPYIALGH